MAKKRQKYKKYSAEFKLCVILDMSKNKLSYRETVRGINLGNSESGGARKMIQRWERIYLEKGAKGLMKERRGQSSKSGRPKKPLDIFL